MAGLDDLSVMQRNAAEIAECRRNIELGIAQSMTHGRGDQMIVREIASYPGAVRLWQSLPIIQFLDGEYLMGLWDDNAHDGFSDIGKKWNTVCGDAMANLFWNDCVFYWVDLELKRRFWVRLRPAASFFKKDYLDDAIMDMRKKLVRLF